MKRLVYSEQSLSDLAGIFDYVAQRNPGAAQTLAADLVEICDLIAHNPEVGVRQEALSPGLRRFTYRRYAIYYRIDDQAVRILRFLHPSRDVGSQSFD